jgi:hypothetical protein
MAEKSVDELRAELRNLGYLTHGIERWFALDPWISRTFWAELVTVTGKAAVLLAFFATLPLVTITALRNEPLPVASVALLFGIDFVSAFLTLLALLVAIALVLRSRPTLAIDSPAALTGVSLAVASLVGAGILLWWSGLEGAPTAIEAVVGGALVILFLIVAALVLSAALLSFSIHEAKRIPLVAQKDRTVPLSIVALLAALAIGAWVARVSTSEVAVPPVQVVVSPTTQRVALLAVDGMTWDLFAAQRPSDLALAFATPLTPYGQTHSSAERWATLGTGTRSRAHQVRAIDGIRLAGSDEVLQSVSRHDYALDGIAVWTGLARRTPLPPTVRRRDYVWEILGARGVPSAAVNWWVTGDENLSGLTSVSQATIFGEASKDGADPVALALSIDRIAIGHLEDAVRETHPRFATAYLPAIDIVLNRIALDQSARAAASIRAAAEVFDAAHRLQAQGYELVIVGMPGEGADANAVLASSLPAGAPPTLDAIAPTLLALMGFPSSDEMSAVQFLDVEGSARIPTYGDRLVESERVQTSDEYYESLKSLGYIR